MICLQNVSYTYPDGTDALRDISLDLPMGGVTAVLGANGAGKTTLFRCILGALRPRTGKILLDGKDVRAMKTAQIAASIAYVPQKTDVPDDISSLEFAAMGAIRTVKLLCVPGKRQYDAARRALEEVGLSEKADRPMGALSGGERQLALIARALAQDAPILLLDEPVSSLDFGNQHRFLQAARALSQQGKTVLLSIHQPQLALQYADRVIALKDGRLAACGGTDRLPDAELIRTLYGVEASVTEIDGRRILY